MDNKEEKKIIIKETDIEDSRIVLDCELPTVIKIVSSGEKNS